jgi:glycosyltransferase involved in cell wall biosynthesis
MVTVIIPSKTEKFLDNTIRDVLKNATGEIEIIPVLDGYDCERIDDPRVHYILQEPSKNTQKRHGINRAVAECKGEYVMALDAHCMVAPGFDEQLVKDHQPNWVQVPRRNRLDAENWCLQTQCDDRPPIDYEYIMYRPLIGNDDMGLHGFKWDARTLARQHIMIDDILTFQGSCWFMTKEWFRKMGFMDLRYTGWGQEAEEISFTTWMNGGECKVNKNTWYAHLHKGKKYGRMYWMSRDENRRSYAYSSELWLKKNKEFMISLFEKFMPLPGWPPDWKEKLWKL